MAKPRKTEDFKDLYMDLSIADKKKLRTELDYAIKDDEKAKKAKEYKDRAMSLRDTLKINEVIRFNVKGIETTGRVIGIGVDKVQVELKNGSRKNLPYIKIILSEN